METKSRGLTLSLNVLVNFSQAVNIVKQINKTFWEEE
jgi:hypothetical protein